MTTTDLTATAQAPLAPTTDTLGACPSWTRPDCDSGAVYAVTELATEWGTGKVVYGPPAAWSPDSAVFTPTTIVVCGNGHRVAGGRKARYGLHGEPARH